MPDLLSSIADLAWPAVVLLGLVLFDRPLAGLLRSGSEREAGRAESPTPVELVSVVPSGAQSAVKQEPAGSTA